MTNPHQPYPGQPYGPPQQQWPPQAPPKRRRVWPWVLIAVVMVPILGFVGCAALVGGAVDSVEDSRKGGTVAIGETFTYKSGLALAVAAPKPYDADNEYLVAKDEQAFESVVTITNGTAKAVGAIMISMNATVAGAPAERVYDGASLTTQDIAPGQKLAVPFRFKVKTGTTGPLQIAVTDTFNEPVFFTGQLG